MRSVAALLALALAGGALADESVLQMGRALYRGEREFSRAPRLNGVELSGMACIQCHGSEGAGLREGGVRAPALQWHLLMLGNPDGPGYADADAVLAAIRDGRGRAQRVLKAPMPRFALSADEGQALVAYLRQLSGRGDEPRGVTDERITVASVLPLSGPQAAVGRLVRSTLEQRFAALNADGGLFGRRIELVVVDAGDSPARASRAARDLLDSGAPPVFALVGSLLPEPNAELRQALAQRQVAMVATLGVPREDSSEARLSYLLPSLAAQVGRLAAELARQCPQPDGATLLLHHSGDPLADRLGSDPGVRTLAITDTRQLQAQLADAGASRVIALLDSRLLDEARQQLAQRSARVCLGSLAVISGAPPQRTPGPLREWVALPMPEAVSPGDGLSASQHLWTLLADTAAQTLIETLARSGKRLTAENLITALGTLQQFEPSPGVVLNFTRQQHHGFAVGLWTGGDHAYTQRQ
ncbi:cytochrome c/ABC transporter substrate-binding protein [Pseudomonas sp. MT3]|nr:ABC transporter substrate-binding protein [uncultured Pseudomonas sp.]